MVLYGRSIPSIGEQLYGKDKSISDEERYKKAQHVYDAVMKNFPGLRNLMLRTQDFARKHGYTETILGRRRHLPDMQLEEFEFRPLKGYVNPDVDPLDITTLGESDKIPKRITDQLLAEFKSYKYFGQIARRTKELYEEHIKVINNRPKINDATRQTLNGVIQGSAADLTKLAMLRLERDADWQRIGGRLLVPIHDELLAEVPIQYAKEGGEILSRCMCEAANFLPFPITCDVTTTYRWYGIELESVESFDKPESLDNLTESNIKWIQAMIYENEYLLPVYPNEDGSKPRGDAALGVNGVWSEELQSHIDDYMSRYQIKSDSEFINHIERKVTSGVIGISNQN